MRKSNHFIVKVGTNDLNTERSLELIAKSIDDLVTALKGDSCDASASNVIVLPIIWI